MKKYLSLAAFAICTICAFTFVSCGEEDDTPTPKTEDKTGTGGEQNGGTTNTDGVVTSADALVGTWKASNFAMSFTTTQLTVKHVQDSRIIYQGPFTLKDGIVSYTQKGDDNKEYTNSFKAETYYDGIVLAKYYVYEEEGKQQISSYPEEIYVKEGKTIPTPNLDGKWYMYEEEGRAEETEEGKPICAAITIKGNSLELIICPWSRKFTGNYTYQNGELTFNIERYFVNYNFEGEDRLNWITLEGKWEELPLTDYNFNMDNPATFAFIVLGDKAFGTVGRPGFYEKQ